MIGGASNTGGVTGAPPFSTCENREMNEIPKVIGRVIKVSKAGWGFISSRDIEFTRIFFHWTSLRQDTIPFLELKTGMMVEFTPLKIEGKGWRAVHIRVVDKKKEEPNDNANQLPVLSQ